MADAVNNTNSSVKTQKLLFHKNCCSIKVFKQFLEIIRMPLIDSKINLELNWIEDSILSSDEDSAKLKIMDAKLHVRIVNLSITENVNLTSQFNDETKRSVYWNNYQTIPVKVTEKRKNIYELLSASFQGVTRLFVLAYFIAVNDANNQAGIKKITVFSS